MEAKKTSYQRRIDSLFTKGRLRRYLKNQLVHYQGDPLTHIYHVKKGYLKAYTILESGDTRTLLLLSPGDIFPLTFTVTMDWSRYRIKYFYQTLCDVELEVIPMEILRDTLENDMFKMQSYMTYLAASNEAILNQLEVMKSKKAITKIEMLLPYLVSKLGQEVKPGTYRLKLKLSHQEIADLSGVTRETTTTLIKQLEKEGVIEQKRGTWIIHTKPVETAVGSLK